LIRLPILFVVPLGDLRWGHRKRRHRGLRYVGVLLHVTEIEALIRKEYLQPDQRENTDALQAAVCDLLAQALDSSA
jgi:hypothetical protein